MVFKLIVKNWFVQFKGHLCDIVHSQGICFFINSRINQDLSYDE